MLKYYRGFVTKEQLSDALDGNEPRKKEMSEAISVAPQSHINRGRGPVLGTARLEVADVTLSAEGGSSL